MYKRSEYQLITSRINEPRTTSMSATRQAGVRYNLSGQQIGQGYKGIIIVNGKKVIQ